MLSTRFSLDTPSLLHPLPRLLKLFFPFRRAPFYFYLAKLKHKPKELRTRDGVEEKSETLSLIKEQPLTGWSGSLM